MKEKIIIGAVAAIAVMLMSGCARSGYEVNKYNGMYYDVTGVNCTYDSLNRKTNVVQCYDKNMKKTRKLYPVHPNAVREKRYQKEKATKAVNNFNRQVAYSNRTSAINRAENTASLNSYLYGYPRY